MYVYVNKELELEVLLQRFIVVYKYILCVQMPRYTCIFVVLM